MPGPLSGQLLHVSDLVTGRSMENWRTELTAYGQCWVK